MEKAANKLAGDIAKALGYDEEKEQVIAYGLAALFQMAVIILLVLIIGLFEGALVEALIICFSVSLLRKYTGGAHADSMYKCIGIAVIYSCLFAAISQSIALDVSFIALLIISIAVYAISFAIAYRKVPVDSPNKPIRTGKKKKRMRKGAFVLLSAYLIISIAFLILGQGHKIFYSFVISLLFGTAWQIFTLTKAGFVFLNKVDFILSKFALRKEVN